MHSMQLATPAVQKRPYVRPELIKHGKVESQTQGPTVTSCSSPVGLHKPA